MTTTRGKVPESKFCPAWHTWRGAPLFKILHTDKYGLSDITHASHGEMCHLETRVLSVAVAPLSWTSMPADSKTVAALPL